MACDIQTVGLNGLFIIPSSEWFYVIQLEGFMIPDKVRWIYLYNVEDPLKIEHFVV